VRASYDALVVGSGPNGLAAAIRLAQARLAVLVVEANPTLGGGARTAELTLPGFHHDVCSAIHPLALSSPFFRTLPLDRFGLEWVQPPVPLAHPLDYGTAAVLHRSLAATASGLGNDGPAWRRLFGSLLDDWEPLSQAALAPLLRLPRRPLALARFGWRAFQSAGGLARRWFRHPPAQALFAGLAAHSFLPLDQSPSAAFGLVLALAGHAVGWPLPRGGAQRLACALAACFQSLGGEVVTGLRVDALEQLPAAKTVVLDLTPRQVLRLLGAKLPARYRRALERFRYGPGVFKLDYALDGPVPWTAPECAQAGTVHLGGTLAEIAAAEKQVAQGQHPEQPFVLVAQPSLFDPARAPAGQHTLWAYCHVPHASSFDMSERIERQLERFAPGFRRRVLARHSMTCAGLEAANANLVGGDINGGLANLRQLVCRPVCRPCPYRLPVPGLYLCSASTPPGGGVHGMCGFYAAEAALADLGRGA
jgi:phytoene dehydrogenase-like protein